ncbi:preprotein translocase subunit SecE [bacterium]|nr:preprotein translocase subunit SecE [bacterium]
MGQNYLAGKNQVVVETFFVVAIVFVFTVFIYVIDKIFEWVLSLI